MEQKSTEQAYACWASTYDREQAPQGQSVEEEVVVSLVPASVENVLDAATGTGRYAVRLAQTGKHVIGVDLSREMLAQARVKAEELGLAIDFRQAPLAALPLPDECVEAVICAMALAHVVDLNGVIREFMRVLREGGVLIISDLHPRIQKRWGPDYTASIKDGRLLVDGQDLVKDSPYSRVPFPQYRTDLSEYVDAVQAAQAEVLTAIDIRAWQSDGLQPIFLVILARKGEDWMQEWVRSNEERRGLSRRDAPGT